ncbi:MAG: hypothetical protein KGH75_03165 [Rhodospirillales bacterium]|nr:hypothetical protein [Rhodospirillales bacterium]
MTEINPVKLRRSKLHATEINRAGSKEKLIGRGGHINASDNMDLLRGIGQLLNQMGEGKIMSLAEAADAQPERVLTTAQAHEAVLSAYNQAKAGDSRAWMELGQSIGTELYETANREGLMRRALMRADVVQGSIPRIPFAFKTSFAWEASSAASIQPTLVRNKYLLPPEFYIEAHLWVEEREIYQSPGDILEEKLMEGQEAIMTREDAVMVKLLQAQVGGSNAPLTIVGGFTPQNLGLMRSELLQWNLPATLLFFASNILNDITTNTTFGTFYDPVSQYEVVQTGFIGRILGISLITDAYRVPQQKVLSAGDIYLLTSPEFLGAYTDRGPVVANEVNASASGHGVPARGWHLFETMSMTVANSRGVVYASSNS